MIANISFVSRKLEVTDFLANGSLWTDGVRLNHLTPFNLMRCTTLNLPLERLEEDATAFLRFYGIAPHFGHVLLEVHEFENSLHNYLMNWGEVTFVRPGTTTSINCGMSKDQRVNGARNTHYCDETNSQRITDCINRFILKKLGCVPPWLRHLDAHGNDCKKYHDVDKLIDIISNFTKTFEEVQEFGCLLPNCHSNVWSQLKMFDYAIDLTRKDIEYTLIFPRGSKVFEGVNGKLNRVIFL